MLNEGNGRKKKEEEGKGKERKMGIGETKLTKEGIGINSDKNIIDLKWRKGREREGK